MASFRLLADHQLQLRRGDSYTAALVEAGTIIDSEAMPPGWKPSLHMEPLDPAAEAMLRSVVERVRTANTQQAGGYGEVPGFGSKQHLPA